MKDAMKAKDKLKLSAVRWDDNHDNYDHDYHNHCDNHDYHGHVDDDDDDYTGFAYDCNENV